MKRNQKSVSDLGAAAYLLMHDIKVIGRRGKDIYFLITDEHSSDKFDQLTLDYLSSEFHRFDAYILMHKYKVVGKRGKAIYFEVEDEILDKFDEIALEYISSDYHRFDSCLMSLKKIGEYISDHN